MRKLPLFCLVAALSFIIICFLPTFTIKIFLAGLTLSITVLLLAIMIEQPVIKYAFITIFSLALPLSLFEGYSHILLYTYEGAQWKQEELAGKKLSTIHPQIGYVPIPNNNFTVRATRGDTLVYQATYTIDAAGRRITPQHPDASTAVLLFGCSFTFGDGVNDTESMPWQLAEKLGPDYQVYNFGYSGYGPHNTLSIIQHALPDLHKYKRILTYFVSLEDHLRRIVGSSNWQAHNPRYMVKDGKAILNGTFADTPPLPWEKTPWQWIQQSAIYKFYRKPLTDLFIPLNTEQGRLELFQALIVTGAEYLHKIYPQNTSTLLVWPSVSHSPFVEQIQFMAKDIPIIDMEPWIPNFSENIEKHIIPGDRHPLPESHAIIATELAKLIHNQSN